MTDDERDTGRHGDDGGVPWPPNATAPGHGAPGGPDGGGEDEAWPPVAEDGLPDPLVPPPAPPHAHPQARDPDGLPTPWRAAGAASGEEDDAPAPAPALDPDAEDRERAALVDDLRAALHRDLAGRPIGPPPPGAPPLATEVNLDDPATLRELAWRGARKMLGDKAAILEDEDGMPIVKSSRTGQVLSPKFLANILPAGRSGGGHRAVKSKKNIFQLMQSRLSALAQRANEEAIARGERPRFSEDEEEGLIAEAFLSMILSDRSVPALKEYLDRTIGPVVQRVEQNVGVRDLVRQEFLDWMKAGGRPSGMDAREVFDESEERDEVD